MYLLTGAFVSSSNNLPVPPTLFHHVLVLPVLQMDLKVLQRLARPCVVEFARTVGASDAWLVLPLHVVRPLAKLITLDY